MAQSTSQEYKLALLWEEVAEGRGAPGLWGSPAVLPQLPARAGIVMGPCGTLRVLPDAVGPRAALWVTLLGRDDCKGEGV